MWKPFYTVFSFFCRYIAKASVRIKCTHMVLRKRASASHYQLIGNRACALVTMIPFAFCEKISIGEHARENGRKNEEDRKRERKRSVWGRSKNAGNNYRNMRVDAYRLLPDEGLLASLLYCHRMLSLPPASSSPPAVPNTVIYSPPGIIS